MAILAEREHLLLQDEEGAAAISVAAFDAAVDAGEFKDARVEYADGRLIYHMSQKAFHVYALRAVARALEASGAGFEVLQQATIAWKGFRLDPDVALLRPGTALEAGYIAATRAVLVVEIAVTTLAYDRRDKTRFYAQGGVPEYWIVSPEHRRVEVYRTPEAGRYTDASVYLPGESFDCLALPGATFAVDDLLPATD